MLLSRIAPTLLALAASCAVTKQVGLQIPGTGSSGSAKITMIDVTGKSSADAEAAVRAAGITASVYVEDNRVCDVPGVEELHVCYTSPRAGQASSTTIPVTLYLRHKETKTFYMPDVRGKTVDEAKQILIGLGQEPNRFLIEEARGADGCQPARICRQSPEPGRQQWVSQAAWLWIGPAQSKPPDAKPPREEPKPIF